MIYILEYDHTDFFAKLLKFKEKVGSSGLSVLLQNRK